MSSVLSPQELERSLGESFKALRLQKNMDQKTLSQRAGISLSALKHLESGQGATIKTLIRVVRALDRVGWILAAAPAITINPLHMLRSSAPRQRASRRSKAPPKSGDGK